MITRETATREITEYVEPGLKYELALVPDPGADAWAARLTLSTGETIDLLVVAEPGYGVDVEEVEFATWPPTSSY